MPFQDLARNPHSIEIILENQKGLCIHQGVPSYSMASLAYLLATP